INIAKELGASLPDTPENIIAKYDQMRNSIPPNVWQTISDLEAKIKSGQISIPLPTTHDEIQAIRTRYGATG
ncbi:MAG: hypothetical protein ACP5OK_06980, partial [Thermoprotei archaeon]